MCSIPTAYGKTESDVTNYCEAAMTTLIIIIINIKRGDNKLAKHGNQ